MVSEELMSKGFGSVLVRDQVAGVAYVNNADSPQGDRSEQPDGNGCDRKVQGSTERREGSKVGEGDDDQVTHGVVFSG